MEIEIPRTSKPSFKRLFSDAVSSLPQRNLTRGECRDSGGKICTLCAAHKIEYDIEQRIKDKALETFWTTHGLSPAIDPIIPSPFGRNYRVVTKRKAFPSGGKLRLGLIGVEEDSAETTPVNVDLCVIEPAKHSEIYHCLQTYINKREFWNDAELINYVVIKGNYDEFAVILNLAAFNTNVRPFVNRLSKHLTETVKGVVSVFVVVDEKRSRYYMPQRSKNQKMLLQKIFGKGEIFLKVGEKKFMYSPLSFSQTNNSILEVFIQTIQDLLDLRPEDRLMDLYCGYGIFSLTAAKAVRSTVGVELSWDAIGDAKRNAERLKITNGKFLQSDIDEENLERILSSNSKLTRVILDPPRNGAKPGVIEVIAAKKVPRVLHIMCNIDLLPAEVERWKDCGYAIARAVPFDMFPGTNEVEIAVCLEKN
jgi:tRNA/tmRNA/rRNA uracil-C5-methylase (TrmA/RlmC/RlmD family)